MLHHQPFNVPHCFGTGLPYGLHIRRTGHNPPCGPSAGWWVLTTANSGANGLTCLPVESMYNQQHVNRYKTIFLQSIINFHHFDIKYRLEDLSVWANLLRCLYYFNFTVTRPPKVLYTSVENLSVNRKQDELILIHINVLSTLLNTTAEACINAFAAVSFYPSKLWF
jgi:hypothetical protein